MEGEDYWIKDNNGKKTKVHVDKSTKMDKVVVGDQVKAYVTDRGPHHNTPTRGLKRSGHEADCCRRKSCSEHSS
ncbi:MAG: hypothetical protein NTNFB02_16910 [Nitrospira sp.]